MPRSVNRGVPVLMAVALLVAGCITPPIEDSAGQANIRDRARALQGFDHWGLSGRLAVSDDVDSGTATAHWERAPTSFLLTLNAPLGQGTWRLFEGEGGAQLERTDTSEIVHGNSVRELLRDHLNWNVPVEAMDYWMRGLPDPEGEFTAEFDRKANLASLRQHGWQLRFDRYRTVEVGANGQAVEIPHRVFADKEPYSVRLVVREWRFDDA